METTADLLNRATEATTNITTDVMAIDIGIIIMTGMAQKRNQYPNLLETTRLMIRATEIM